MLKRRALDCRSRLSKLTGNMAQLCRNPMFVYFLSWAAMMIYGSVHQRHLLGQMSTNTLTHADSVYFTFRMDVSISNIFNYVRRMHNSPGETMAIQYEVKM